jgi:cell division transport system permease protein
VTLPYYLGMGVISRSRYLLASILGTPGRVLHYVLTFPKRISAIRLDRELIGYYTRVYLREGWYLIIRNRFLSLFAGATIFTLLTMGYTLIVLNAHLGQVLSQANSNLIVTVVLQKDASPEQVEQEVRQLPHVTSITYISSTQARNNFVEQTHLPPGNTPNATIFPQLLEVHTQNASQISHVANEIAALPGVYGQPQYLKGLISQITGTTKGLRTIALFTTVFLGILAIALLIAIVRVTIYARRRNVRVMSLVGASRSAITLPLIAQIGIITLVAGTAACLVGWVIDPQLGVGNSLISGQAKLPPWLHTTRAYGLFALWPLIVPSFMLVASLIVMRTVRHYARD